jgi:hypothetical protein
VASQKQKPTSLSDLLAKGEGTLQRLREGATGANRALEAARRHLPAELAVHVWGAGFTGGVLSLLVESASWATRLRYAIRGVAGTLGTELGEPVQRVVVKVRPRP